MTRTPGDVGASDHYLIRGGLAGRQRLRVLSRVMWPTTRELLARVGVPEDARCLDVGCGGGDVTIPLARLASRGCVVGTDIDETKLELARAETLAAGVENVEFRLEDVTRPSRRAEWFDLVYARFLLTHLADPAESVARLVARLQPGGVLVVEDIDCSGHFCHPDSAAFRRYVALYSGAARARGGDPEIGPKLPGLLAGAGLRELGSGGELRADAEVPGQYRQMIVNAAHGCARPEVTPALIAAMLAAESGFDPAKRSPATDEYGIALWTPKVFEHWKVDADGGGASVFSAADSIAALGRFLCTVIDRNQHIPGDRALVLAAVYRVGGDNVRAVNGIPPQARDYIGRVRRHLAEFAEPPPGG